MINNHTQLENQNKINILYMQKLETLHQFYCCKKKLGLTIPLILIIFNLTINISGAYSQSQSLKPVGLSQIGNSPNGTLSAAGIINCSPPTCIISGSSTICPGTSNLLCAPAGLLAYLWSTGSRCGRSAWNIFGRIRCPWN